jgi:(R,R)-butanediol dehydrogenase/meso-butanediol dehydrogenase/diacetyl reductase
MTATHSGGAAGRVRAVRFHGARDLRVEDLPRPRPDTGEVAVDVAWCGICGSDLHEFRHGPSAIPVAGRPHPLTGAAAPITLGHEFAGTVTAVGPDVAGFAPGDRVAIEPLLRDGTCAACRSGSYNRCRRLAFIGLSAAGGGLAEHAVVPAGALHRVPDGVSLEAAALAEPAAVAWHAVDRAELTAGDQVLVIGAGPVGLAIIGVLRYRYASTVIVSEPSAARRAAALRLGAQAALHPGEADIAKQAGGSAAAFDCAGHPLAAETGLRAVRPGGRAVLVAQPGAALSVPAGRLVYLEATLTGSIAYADGVFPAVLAAMAAGLDLTPMISRRARLDEAPALIEELAAGDGHELKVLLGNGDT